MLANEINEPNSIHLGIAESQVLSWASDILEQRFKRSHYLKSPQASHDYLKLRFAQEFRELFGLVYLDSQHGVLGSSILFQGTIDGASVYPREVVKSALEHNAAAVILMHNHPSGSAKPSQADIAITQRIVTALNTVDINVLDHLILAGNEHLSFADRGLLPACH